MEAGYSPCQKEIQLYKFSKKGKNLEKGKHTLKINILYFKKHMCPFAPAFPSPFR